MQTNGEQNFESTRQEHHINAQDNNSNTMHTDNTDANDKKTNFELNKYSTPSNGKQTIDITEKKHDIEITKPESRFEEFNPNNTNNNAINTIDALSKAADQAISKIATNGISAIESGIVLKELDRITSERNETNNRNDTNVSFNDNEIKQNSTINTSKKDDNDLLEKIIGTKELSKPVEDIFVGESISTNETNRKNDSFTPLNNKNASEEAKNTLREFIENGRNSAKNNNITFTEEMKNDAVKKTALAKMGMTVNDNNEVTSINVDNSAGVATTFKKLQEVQATGQSSFEGELDIKPLGEKDKPFGSSIALTDKDKISKAQNDVVKKIDKITKATKVAGYIKNFSYDSLRGIGRFAELNSDETFSGFSSASMYAMPIIKSESMIISGIASNIKATKMIAQMDFKEINKILQVTSNPKNLNALASELIKKGGVNKFSFSASGVGKSGIDFGNLNKNLYQAAAKYGGIFANVPKDGLSNIALNQQIRELKRLLKTTSDPQALKELKEQLQVVNMLKALKLKESGNMLNILKTQGRSMFRVSTILMQSITSDVGQDMVKKGTKVSGGIRTYLKVKDKFTNVYKKSKLINKTKLGNALKNKATAINKLGLRTDRKIADAINKKPVREATKKVAKGLKNTLSDTKVGRGTSKILHKASREVGTRLAKHARLQKATGKLANIANGAGSKLISGLSKVNAKMAQTALAALNKLGISAGAAAGSGAAGAGAAAGGTALTVGTGGLALVIAIIIAIIICCCCCCCSFGVNYESYENVDAFYTNADGKAVSDAKDSLAARTIKYMADNFEANYPQFIYNGVDKKISSLSDVAAFTYNGIDYEAGKVQTIEPGETSSKYEKYIFIKDDPSSIYYSDENYTINYALGGKKIYVDDDGSYKVKVGVTSTKDGNRTDTNQISNVKEVVAMASTAMANDFGATKSGGETNVKKSAANFANYCYTEWLASHYCVYEDGGFMEWLKNKVASFFHKDAVSSVEATYTSKINDNKIYLASIAYVWESISDPNEGINKITPLNANEYAPENYHYLNTALKLPTDKLNGLANELSGLYSLDSDYIHVSGTTSSSINSYAAQISANADGTIMSSGSQKSIANSTFTTSEISANYYHISYTENTSALDPTVEAAYADGDNHTDEDDPKDVLAKYNSWITTISNYTTEDYENIGYLVKHEVNGFVFETEDDAKQAAKDYVNKIYDKIEGTFGKITNSQKGSPLTTGLKDSMECGSPTIPKGAGYGTSSAAKGYTTREDALQMVDDAYNKASIDQKRIEKQAAYNHWTYYYNYTYKAVLDGTCHHDTIDPETGKKVCTEDCHPKYKYEKNPTKTFVYVNPGKKSQEFSYIMLFADPNVKAPSKKVGTETIAGNVTFKNLYKQYFVCGGHTRLVIEPVTLTYTGNTTTMFDVDNVIGQLASDDASVAITYAKTLGVDSLSAQFIVLTGGKATTDSVGSKMWNVETSIGRENILNATNMVDKNWEQYYGFKWNELTTSVDSKILDPLAESLYQTKQEATDAGSSTASIEELTKIAESALTSADYNGDGSVNSEDYKEAKEAGASNDVLNNISSAINRMDRCVLAMSLVGKVGYSQASHDYVLTGPLKTSWSFNHSSNKITVNGKTINLGELYSNGDGYDYGLLYKTDCSGFASYIIGADNELFTTASLAGGVTVTLPKLSTTINNYKKEDFSKLDGAIQALYGNDASKAESESTVTYQTKQVTWNTSTAKSLKPGDLVSRTTNGSSSGHVMVYIGPANSSYTELYFIHCTSKGSVLGPGSVELKKMNISSLGSSSSGYPNVTTVDYDVRDINFKIDRSAIIISSGTGTGVGNFDLTIEGANNKEKVESALKSITLSDGTKLSNAQIAGILGNLQAENGFSTAGNSSTYGIMQWMGGRKASLLMRPDYNTIEGQIKFMLDEFNGSESGSFKSFIRDTQGIDDPIKAADAFAIYCERCPWSPGQTTENTAIAYNGKRYQGLATRRNAAQSFYGSMH